MANPIPLLLAEPGEGDQRGEDNARRELRSNLFVVATLDYADHSAPVRIRNLSRTGALIEGAMIPPEGGAVVVRRGSRAAAGTVVWRRENRSGIRFDCTIHVADWLPAGSRSAGQQRVDELVYAYKNSTPSGAASAAGHLPHDRAALDDIHRMLVCAAEELAGEPVVFERHPTALQMIDMAAQKIAQLGK